MLHYNRLFSQNFHHSRSCWAKLEVLAAAFPHVVMRFLINATHNVIGANYETCTS